MFPLNVMCSLYDDDQSKTVQITFSTKCHIKSTDICLSGAFNSMKTVENVRDMLRLQWNFDITDDAQWL